MDLLTNQTLLTMVQSWQDVHSGKARYGPEYPPLEEVMKELIKRDMASASWRWTVNLEDVDMAWTRTRLKNVRA